jgi:hypothetical protein
MPNQSLKSLVTTWRKLTAAAEVHEVELPSLGTFKAALEETLEDIAASKSRQMHLRKRCAAATQELNDNVAAGLELARRLKSYALACFGRTDERLADFGIKSWGRHRKPKELEQGNGSPGYH